MHVNDTFGQAMNKGISAMLPRLTQLPFKIVDTISYDPAAKDLSVEVSKAKAANADFLLLVCRLNDAIILRREMVKQRWNPMGIVSPGSPGLYEDQYLQDARQARRLRDLEHALVQPEDQDDRRRSSAAFAKQYPKDEHRHSTAPTSATPSRRS